MRKSISARQDIAREVEAIEWSEDIRGQLHCQGCGLEEQVEITNRGVLCVFCRMDGKIAQCDCCGEYVDFLRYTAQGTFCYSCACLLEEREERSQRLENLIPHECYVKSKSEKYDCFLSHEDGCPYGVLCW
jgi:hypothetical protein